jgi:chorismate-pyruvate lyase
VEHDPSSLFAFFPGTAPPKLERVEADEVPQPYRDLLVHTVHMTVTVEKYYADAVDVQVLELSHIDNTYTRQIVLALRASGHIVQYGLVQIDLDALTAVVRDRILEGKTPLGRVLIEHDVLRHIEPAGYFRVTLNNHFQHWLRTEATTTYGRMGVIHTDHRPAIRVLEILTPVPIVAQLSELSSQNNSNRRVERQ